VHVLLVASKRVQLDAELEARSAVCRMNNSWPRTEPCGVEHVIQVTREVFPAVFMTKT